MPRTAPILLTVLFSFSLLVSCNSASDKKPSGVDTGSVTHVQGDADCNAGNFTVDEATAKGLIRHFDDIFVHTGTPQEVTGLQKQYWVDSTVIRSYARLLNSNPSGYDGLWFYFGSDNTGTTLLLVPSRASLPKHAYRFGTLLRLPPGASPVFKKYNLDQAAFDPLALDFKTRFRHESTPDSIDSLSKGVWFSTCVISTLDQCMSDPAQKIDGIRVYSAAYKDRSFNTNNTQIKDNQSTVIIVATNPSDTAPDHHADNWNLLNKFFTEKLHPLGGFNHGELCPNNCN